MEESVSSKALPSLTRTLTVRYWDKESGRRNRAHGGLFEIRGQISGGAILCLEPGSG